MKKILSLALIVLLLGNMKISSTAAGLSVIDSKTFKSNYKITTVHIGSDVSEITDTAFRNLNNLRSITVSDNNMFYASYSGCLYDKNYTELVCYPPALSGAYIPSTVVSISTYALHGVPEGIKEEIRNVIKAQAAENLPEMEIPGAHFVHTSNGVKWKDDDGNVTSPYSAIMNQAANVVEASSTRSMSQSKQLEAAFNYVASNTSYVRSLDTPTGDWVKSYAMETLGTGTGNCYGYAAAFAYVARGLGYESRVCTGTVQSALGGRTDHAWTEVKVGGKWYIFDTEMQNAKGSGYYKQTYDSYPAGPIEKLESYSVEF